jgi:hypothetical protein
VWGEAAVAVVHVVVVATPTAAVSHPTLGAIGVAAQCLTVRTLQGCVTVSGPVWAASVSVTARYKVRVMMTGLCLCTGQLLVLRGAWADV